MKFVRNRVAALASVAVAAALVLTGCADTGTGGGGDAGGESGGSDNLTITFLPKNLGNPYFDASSVGGEAAVERHLGAVGAPRVQPVAAVQVQVLAVDDVHHARGGVHGPGDEGGELVRGAGGAGQQAQLDLDRAHAQGQHVVDRVVELAAFVGRVFEALGDHEIVQALGHVRKQRFADDALRRQAGRLRFEGVVALYHRVGVEADHAEFKLVELFLRAGVEEVGQAALDVHKNAHQGKVGVLCLAPEEGLGVRDTEMRAKHEGAINRFRGV